MNYIRKYAATQTAVDRSRVIVKIKSKRVRQISTRKPNGLWTADKTRTHAIVLNTIFMRHKVKMCETRTKRWKRDKKKSSSCVGTMAREIVVPRTSYLYN